MKAKNKNGLTFGDWLKAADIPDSAVWGGGGWELSLAWRAGDDPASHSRKRSWQPCAHRELGCPWDTLASDGFCEACRNMGCHKPEHSLKRCNVREAVKALIGKEGKP